MKIFGTDISTKYIYVRDHKGHEYCVQYKRGIFKGYHDIVLIKHENEQHSVLYTQDSELYKEGDGFIEVINVYPAMINLPKKIYELIIFGCYLKMKRAFKPKR